MHRNLVLTLCGIAAVALVAFAVLRGRNQASPTAAPSSAVTPTAAGAAAEPDLSAVARIDVQQLHAKMQQNAVMVIDVRDIDSYTSSHIAGAGQIPLSRVESEVPYLPQEKQIVFYCTCPHDEAAAEAVLILEHAGRRNSVALRGGLDAWRTLGLPTASGTS